MKWKPDLKSNIGAANRSIPEGTPGGNAFTLKAINEQH